MPDIGAVWGFCRVFEAVHNLTPLPNFDNNSSYTVVYAGARHEDLNELDRLFQAFLLHVHHETCEQHHFVIEQKCKQD